MTNKQLAFSLIVGIVLLVLGAAVRQAGSSGIALIALGTTLMSLSIADRVRRPRAELQFEPLRSPQNS